MMTLMRQKLRLTGGTCAGFVFLGALLSGLPDAPGAAPAPLAALPPVPVPADNPITPAKVKLGRMLFSQAAKIALEEVVDLVPFLAEIQDLPVVSSSECVA